MSFMKVDAELEENSESNDESKAIQDKLRR
jgi:hypothetical protein